MRDLTPEFRDGRLDFRRLEPTGSPIIFHYGPEKDLGYSMHTDEVPPEYLLGLSEAIDRSGKGGAEAFIVGQMMGFDDPDDGPPHIHAAVQYFKIRPEESPAGRRRM